MQKVTAQQIAILGVLAALAAAMQGAAAYWPGPGHLLAAAASLPAAVAAWLAGPRALLFWAAVVLTLALIHGEEAAVFLLTTGPVGLAAGWGLRRGWGVLRSGLLAGGALTVGLLILTFVVRLPALGPSLSRRSAAAILAHVGFATAWGLGWAWLTQRVLARVGPLAGRYRT